MKKIMRFLVCICSMISILSMISVGAMAEEKTKIVERGKLGDSINYTLDNKGVLTVSGKGRMYDYELEGEKKSPVSERGEEIKKIVIKEGITYIGKCTFADDMFAYDIIISEGVTEIGEQAFFGCYYTENISFPDSLKIINKGAFFNIYCSWSEINLPENLEYIGIEAFGGCKDLKSLYIPAKVKTIEDRAFYHCKDLVNIKVDEKNEYYDSRNNCNALIRKSDNCLILGSESTVIPDNIKSIADSAFYGCGIKEAEIPEGVEEIPDGAFRDCENMKKLIIQSSVKYIAWEPFPDEIEKIVFKNVKLDDKRSGFRFFSYMFDENGQKVTFFESGAAINGTYTKEISNIGDIVHGGYCRDIF